MNIEKVIKLLDDNKIKDVREMLVEEMKLKNYKEKLPRNKNREKQINAFLEPQITKNSVFYKEAEDKQTIVTSYLAVQLVKEDRVSLPHKDEYKKDINNLFERVSFDKNSIDLKTMNSEDILKNIKVYKQTYTYYPIHVNSKHFYFDFTQLCKLLGFMNVKNEQLKLEILKDNILKITKKNGTIGIVTRRKVLGYPVEEDADRIIRK